MSKKRVHEIAKEQGLTSKELLEKLNAAGIEAKAAASSVDEAAALKALALERRASRATAADPPPAPRRRATATPAAAQPPEPPAARQRRREPAAEAAPGDAAKSDAERVRPTRDSRTGERAPARPPARAGAGAW